MNRKFALMQKSSELSKRKPNVSHSGGVAVIGLGKMGLPFALQCSRNNFRVIGCDSNLDLVENLNKGITELDGEPEIVDALHESLSNGNFIATSDSSAAISSSEFVVVLVPVYVDEEGIPDFRSIDSVAQKIGSSLGFKTLVCFETTLPVGTTRNRLTKIIEEASGKIAGIDFFVAFSPERVSSGSVFEDLRKYPKLVGGINQKSTDIAVDFYERALDFDSRTDLSKPNGVWPLANSEAAELAKLAETTYRDVNIGLANQFAIYAETIGADIYEIIAACNTQPYSHIHQPGIAVGGHCIPVYPHMYLQGDRRATIVHAAREANKRMPIHAVNLVEKHLGSLKGKIIAILGLAYRAGVKEDAFSGAWDLMKIIRERGGVPLLHDPLFSDEELVAKGIQPFNLNDPCDAVILHTKHEDYLEFNTKSFPGAKVFFDGRNAEPKGLPSHINYLKIGNGNE